MEILQRYTPMMQPVSIDEAYLDVTGAAKALAEAAEVARKIKADIRTQTQLSASVGVASNKFLAKMASDLHKPDGLTVITEEDKLRVLAPLPVAKIHGVGKVTEQRLHELGIRTIGDRQRYPLEKLRDRFGNMAFELRSLAMGEDEREVVTDEETKSISSEHTFGQDTADLDKVRRCLLEQAEEVAMRLRRESLAARTVQLKLRYADFTTLTRRKTLPTPTQDEMALYQTAEKLLLAQNLGGRLIRLIGVGGSNLVKPEFQLELFDPSGIKRARVVKAVDELRARLGPHAVRRGSSMGR